MPSVSPIKHLTKEVKPLCAPVQSVRVSFTWGKHLPLFMKGCCEQAMPENAALTKHKVGQGGWQELLQRPTQQWLLLSLLISLLLPPLTPNVDQIP